MACSSSSSITKVCPVHHAPLLFKEYRYQCRLQAAVTTQSIIHKLTSVSYQGLHCLLSIIVPVLFLGYICAWRYCSLKGGCSYPSCFWHVLESFVDEHTDTNHSSLNRIGSVKKSLHRRVSITLHGRPKTQLVKTC